ncbi:MAG: hypothetical protein ACFB5Z_07095 [Elainellaceae cyanobacterium]
MPDQKAAFVAQTAIAAALISKLESKTEDFAAIFTKVAIYRLS